jgi:BirA family transcriptional regulator, biotin operon repressor / biotin---[acetyl-CoA-carboxylase] ligase
MKNFNQPLKLIERLADGEFHSGEALGEYFGITRVAINKQIKILRSWGINLTSIPHKGYRLDTPLQLLKLEQINVYCNADAPMLLIPVIDSTNQYLLNQITQLKSGTACVAEYQTNGRGRRGRQWFSPFGSNLYLSLYWRFNQGPAATIGLSLAIGTVIAKVLYQISGKEVKVKWPNDLYLEDKKLAGILVEMVGRTGDDAHVVMGVGINLAMAKPDQTIVNQQWANLGRVDRNQLVGQLIQALRTAMTTFEKEGLSAFINDWNTLDNFVGRPVKLLIGDKQIYGIARGINQQGALLLEQQGQLNAYVGGEISLRADD